MRDNCEMRRDKRVKSKSVKRSAKTSKSDSSQFDKQMLVSTAEDMRFRKWEQVDIVIVTGDAYVDHPAGKGTPK